MMDFVSWDDELFPMESHHPVKFQSPPTRFTAMTGKPRCAEPLGPCTLRRQLEDGPIAPKGVLSVGDDPAW